MVSRSILKGKIIKLLESWRNISQVCNEIWISRQTFYNRTQKGDRFTQKIELAQTALERKSNEIIMQALQDWDLSIAKRYLDRKMKYHWEEKSSQNSLDDIIKEIMEEEKPLVSEDSQG